MIFGNGSGGREQPRGKAFDEPYMLFDLEADPEELQSVHGDPGYADVQAQLEVKLDSLRLHFAVPEVDDVPYVDWPPGGSS